MLVDIDVYINRSRAIGWSDRRSGSRSPCSIAVCISDAVGEAVWAVVVSTLERAIRCEADRAVGRVGANADAFPPSGLSVSLPATKTCQRASSSTLKLSSTADGTLLLSLVGSTVQDSRSPCSRRRSRP